MRERSSGCLKILSLATAAAALIGLNGCAAAPTQNPQPTEADWQRQSSPWAQPLKPEPPALQSAIQGLYDLVSALR